MNEEEIIKVITYKLNMKNADVYAPILYEEIQNLLDLYNKEKEKNKELEEHQKQYLDGELITANQGKFFEKIIKENYIRKDRIRAIMEDLNNKIKNAEVTEAILMIKQQQILQKVLEE